MADASCSAATSCSDDVRTWALAHGTGFLSRRLGLKRLTVALPLLLRCIPADEAVTIVDVGAAIHGLAYPWNMMATGLRDDGSDSLWLLGGFGHRAHVHAFEPNPDKAAELRQASTQRPYTRSFSRQLTVHTAGVGPILSPARLVQCGNNSLSSNNKRLEVGEIGSACGGKLALHAIDTNVTSLDAFAYGGGLASPDLLYIKVDVEGREWGVLGELHRLLSEGRVSIASFEYADAWNPLFSLRRPLSPAEVAQARSTSLRAF
jgi:FkbM family methyltransferase